LEALEILQFGGLVRGLGVIASLPAPNAFFAHMVIDFSRKVVIK
jgi:hypothetical protein